MRYAVSAVSRGAAGLEVGENKKLVDLKVGFCVHYAMHDSTGKYETGAWLLAKGEKHRITAD